MKDMIKKRGRALEEEFFEKENERVRAEFAARLNREAARKELAAACGVSDEALLDRLLDQGVSAESLAALAVVPLVMVAWADRKMDAPERAAILESAAKLGIDPESAPHQLLEHWLSERPRRQLEDAWREYVRLVGQALEEKDREKFAQSILGQAREVAEAAGGLLGIGPAVSAAEAEVLERLKQAFD